MHDKRLNDQQITILEQHKRVLFWARRLSYAQACNHPEWLKNYQEEKAKLDQMKAQRKEA